MSLPEIEAIVLEAMRNANLARDPPEQLEIAPTARIFGRGSPLDSLGLVALLIDVEEAMLRAGAPVMLTDDRAMSQTQSPFRSVPALVAYIDQLLARPS